MSRAFTRSTRCYVCCLLAALQIGSISIAAGSPAVPRRLLAPTVSTWAPPDAPTGGPPPVSPIGPPPPVTPTGSQTGLPPIAPPIALAPDPTFRTYYIAAELTNWTYVPDGANKCADPSAANAPTTHVSSLPFVKAVFLAYTDDTFQEPLARSPEEQHLGILGPVMRAEVGETILVVFKNMLPFPANIEPSGVSYGELVAAEPGRTVQYLWTATNVSGPNLAQGEKSSKLWLYRSTFDVAAHVHAGLWGPLVVTAKGAATSTGKPKDVDKEFFLTFQSFNEKATPAELQQENAALIDGEEDEAIFHSVNGILWCNLKGLVSNVGDRVRWYVAGMGGETSRHNMHWHGITLDYQGHHLDGMNLLPGTTRTLDSIMDNPGTWLVHCHVNTHFGHGMDALFTVNGASQHFNMTGRIRQYYIAAQMVEWNYAPLGGSYCSGKLENFTEDASVFLEPGTQRIGSKYMKTVYIEYTDKTFTRRKPRPARLRHTGFLGPVLRAEVGDTIRVLFKNMLPNDSVSLHPHGVLYGKGAEGAPYNDNSVLKQDDAVPPNGTWQYDWLVRPRSGPGPADGNTVMWMYHSHTDETRDTESGLLGPMIIGARGALQVNGLPKDVNNEFFMHFSVMNENENLLINTNIAKYLNITDPAAVEELSKDGEFYESNLMHSINGFMYCNIPNFNLRVNETARFYIMALGDEVDIHTPFSFSTRWVSEGHKREALRAMPGTMIMADVKPDSKGLFGIKCKVDDHLKAGMDALLNVTDAPLPAEAVGAMRRVYVAAELVTWDYAPDGYDNCRKQQFAEDALQYTNTTNTTIGSRYLKAVYREYTDWSFTTPVPRPAYQGLLGPTLRVEPGDTLSIVFRNNLGDTHGFPVNLQPAGGLVLNGFLVTKGADLAGADPELNTVTPDLLEGIPPGATAIYEWYIPENAGPGPDDTKTAVAYAYLSTVNEVAHTHAGLMGVLLVTTKGGMANSSSLVGVDLELPVLMTVINEQASPLLQANIDSVPLLKAEADFDKDSDDFVESNQKHAVNGFLYCNQPAPVLTENSTVLVIMIALGSEDGVHGAIFMGQTLEIGNRAAFAPQLLPAVTEVALMHPTGPGDWQYHCGITDHYKNGMVAVMHVVPAPGPALSSA